MDYGRTEIKLLQCLVTLIEEQSVTKAAERLELSQPRMSNSLRRLRELFDDPLLVRAGQRLVPTERGLEIASRIRRSLDEIDHAFMERMSFDPATANRHYTIMMSDYTAAILLPELLRRTRMTAPGIEIGTVQMAHASLHRSLDESVCDLAFGYFAGLHMNLRVSTCFKDIPVCIGSAEHWSGTSKLTMDMFLHAGHVAMGASPTEKSTIDVVLDRNLQGRGLHRKTSVQVATPLTMAGIVAATDLLGILPLRYAIDFADKSLIKIFELPMDLPSFDVTMVWHERSQRDPAHIWLRNQFRAILADMPPITLSKF